MVNRLTKVEQQDRSQKWRSD